MIDPAVTLALFMAKPSKGSGGGPRCIRDRVATPVWPPESGHVPGVGGRVVSGFSDNENVRRQELVDEVEKPSPGADGERCLSAALSPSQPVRREVDRRVPDRADVARSGIRGTGGGPDDGSARLGKVSFERNFTGLDHAGWNRLHPPQGTPPSFGAA